MTNFIQLPLGIGLKDDVTFDNYFAADNKYLVDLLRNNISSTEHGSEELFVYFYGKQAVGCSHLLQASCNQASISGLQSVYLPMQDIIGLSCGLLDGMGSLDCVCIDNIDFISKHADWQEAVFHLFNQLRENKKCLIVAGRVPPKQLSLELADLASRLTWCHVFQVYGLSDEDMVNAFKLKADFKGMNMPYAIARYICHRSSRNTSDLFKLLKKLDRESLAAKRKITIPFVREVLGWD